MHAQPATFKWTDTVKEILLSTGRPDLWENQFNSNNANIHKQIKQTLIDQFKQNWQSQLQLTNKGLIYNSLKSDHTTLEHYITSLGDHDAMTLFKFRTANHRLPVETGRYDATPFENRICTLFNSKQVGTEWPFLLHCTHFQEDRTKFLNFSNTPPHVSINSLVASTNLKLLKRVSKFANVIMNAFKN